MGALKVNIQSTNLTNIFNKRMLGNGKKEAGKGTWVFSVEITLCELLISFQKHDSKVMAHFIEKEKDEKEKK